MSDITKMTPMTIHVIRIASRRVGHDTLRNSPMVSWKNLWIFNQVRWKKFFSWRADLKSGTVILHLRLKRRLF
jgi:hypothetical protein